MTILEPTNAEQSFAVWPRNDSFVSGASIATAYSARVALDGGVLEAFNCLKLAIEDLLGTIITLVNENTNSEIQVNITSSNNDNGYLTINITTGAGELYESAYFILTLKNSEGYIVYRSRVFCTAQEPKEYTLNENEFVFAPTLDNQFIIL